MAKLGIMAAKQSALFQSCCSLAVTEAKDSSTTTKAGPLDISHLPCFPAANREPSIPYFKKKSDWERYWKDSQKNCQTMVVIFTATWFHPGYDAEKEMKNLAIEFKDVRFARLDVDHLMDVAKERKVERILTFILFKRVQDEDKKDNDVKGSMAKEVGKEGNKDRNGSTEGNMSKQDVKKANMGEKGNKGKNDSTEGNMSEQDVKKANMGEKGNKDKNDSKEGNMSKQDVKKSMGEKGSKSKEGNTILLKEVCRVDGHQENVFSDLRKRFNEHGIIHD